MAIPRYSPPLERIREEYSRMVARKVMARRRPPRPEESLSKIMDNSTPWVENPQTYDDLWFISTSVQQLVDTFHKWRVPSTPS